MFQYCLLGTPGNPLRCPGQPQPAMPGESGLLMTTIDPQHAQQPVIDTQPAHAQTQARPEADLTAEQPLSETPSTARLRTLQAMLDRSPRMLQLQRQAAMLAHSPRALQLRAQEEALARRPQDVAGRQAAPAPNHRGLPDALKAGVEALSGVSLDHVQVHYNSDKPAQLSALAYAQGHEIHVAPGQEQHLPHEAWHVVQQAQGRVGPTTQLAGVAVNDDGGLEQEATVMGQRAAAMSRVAAAAEPSAADSALANSPHPAAARTPTSFPSQPNVQLTTEITHTAGKAKFDDEEDVVGLAMDAKLDPKDPVRGSAPEGGISAFYAAFGQANPGGAWARGHLLNHDLGGRGVPVNLYPITREANSLHSVLVEQPIKNGLSLLNDLKKDKKDKFQDWRMHYHVTVLGTPAQSSFECEWNYIDQAGNGKTADDLQGFNAKNKFWISGEESIHSISEKGGKFYRSPSGPRLPGWDHHEVKEETKWGDPGKDGMQQEETHKEGNGGAEITVGYDPARVVKEYEEPSDDYKATIDEKLEERGGKQLEAEMTPEQWFDNAVSEVFDRIKNDFVGETKPEIEEFLNPKSENFKNEWANLSKAGGTPEDGFYESWVSDQVKELVLNLNDKYNKKRPRATNGNGESPAKRPKTGNDKNNNSVQNAVPMEMEDS